MNKLLLASFMLGSLLATPVLAQSAPPPPNPPAADGPDKGSPPNAPKPPGQYDNDMGPGDHPWDHPDHPGFGGPGGPGDPGWGHGGPKPPPPQKGAHFRIERDEGVVDVMCSDSEPMKPCADMVMQLVDKVLGPGGPGGHPVPPPPPGSAPPPPPADAPKQP